MKPELTPEVPKAIDPWQFVVDTLRDATIQLIDLTNEEIEALTTNFWNSHTALLEKYEQIQPGISERVFLVFEQLGNQKQREVQEHFEKVILPKTKRRAFINGMLGHQVTLTRKNED